jgi:hypothetical protein
MSSEANAASFYTIMLVNILPLSEQESSIWQEAAKLLSGEDLVGGSRPLVAASE